MSSAESPGPPEKGTARCTLLPIEAAVCGRLYCPETFGRHTSRFPSSLDGGATTVWGLAGMPRKTSKIP